MASTHASGGATAVPAESIINHDELTDLRAYQRTFDGAYTRTALGQLSYAILILKLFEKDFYWCGLVYTALAAQLIFIGAYRYNLATSNVDRWKHINLTSRGVHVHDGHHRRDGETLADHPDVQQEGNAGGNSDVQHVGHQSLFRQTFRTAGAVVALATIGTLLLEIALAVLVVRM
jgi:hypothetical protein